MFERTKNIQKKGKDRTHKKSSRIFKILPQSHSRKTKKIEHTKQYKKRKISKTQKIERTKKSKKKETIEHTKKSKKKEKIERKKIQKDRTHKKSSRIFKFLCKSLRSFKKFPFLG